MKQGNFVRGGGVGLILLAVVQTSFAQSLPLVPTWLQGWFSGFTVGLGDWSGSLGLQYMHGEQTTSTANAGSFGNKTNTYGEMLRISNAGFYVLSPLLFTGGLSADLQLTQDTSTGAGADSALTGKTIGYAFDGTFLSQKSYPVNVFARKTQIQLVQDYGARVVGLTTGKGIVFNLHQDSILNDMGYPWTEGVLELSQEGNQTTTTSFDRTQTTDEQLKTVRMRATKGFETADLTFDYYANNRQSALAEQVPFKSQLANLSYSLDFGPTLNRRLDSTLSYQARQGDGESTSISSSNQLQLGHRKNLSSSYGYTVTQQTADDATVLSQSANAAVSHQLYRNLSTNLGINAGNRSLTGGSSRNYGGTISQAYQHSVPGDGSFSANWSRGYGIQKSAGDVSEIPVIEEKHLVTQPLTNRVGFKTSRDNVVTSKPVRVYYYIVATAILQLLTEGADYTLETRGNQTWIIPEPTSLWFVGAPDPIELRASYNYQVDPNASSTTQSKGYGFGLDYGWINGSFGKNQSIETPQGVTGTRFLQNSEQQFVQIGLRGDIRETQTSADFTYETSLATNEVKNQIKLTGVLTWDNVYEMQDSVNIQIHQSKYTLPDVRTSRLLAAQATLQWPEQTLRLSLFANHSAYFAPGLRTDSTLSVNSSLYWRSESGWRHGVGVDWARRQRDTAPAEFLVQLKTRSSAVLGKLTLNADLAYGQWLNADSRSVSQSVNLSAERQF